MIHRILFAAAPVFAAQANALIAETDQALVLSDASLGNEGSVIACLTRDSTRAVNSSGTLIEILVFEGSVKSVEKKLAEAIAENPYVRPLKVLGFKPLPDAEPAKTGEAPPKEGEGKPPVAPESKSRSAGARIIILAGKFQA